MAPKAPFLSASTSDDSLDNFLEGFLWKNLVDQALFCQLKLGACLL